MNDTMKNSGIIIGAVILAMVAVVSVIGIVVYKPQPVLLQGQTEAAEVRIAVKVAGRVKTKNVQPGDRVEKGQLLLQLESPEIDAKLKQANAATMAAKAQQKKAVNGAREEQIRAALSNLQKAEAAADLARKTYERVKNLHQDGVVTTQKLDEAKTQMDVANLNAEAARAAYQMTLDAVRSEDKEAAAALVDQASGTVAEVEAYKSETEIYAPIAGEIAQINIEAGELLTPGMPALSIMDLTDSWVTFHVREDLLSKIEMGKEFEALFPALGNKTLVLRVTFISPDADFATWRATKASGDFDLRSFEVRAKPVQPEPKLRPGMSAIVNWSTL